MQGRSLAIILSGVIAIGSYIQYNMLQSNKRLTENVLNYTSRQTAQNIAQTGVYMGLRKLAENRNWRAGYKNLPLMGGNLTVRIVDTVFNGKNVIGVLASAKMPYSTWTDSSERLPDTVGNSRAYLPKGFIPASVKAAITANNPIVTLGTLTTDGRDHDLEGSKMIPNQGTLGIWTTKTYDQRGDSHTGGTDSASRVDYEPDKPAHVKTFKTFGVWPGGYPGTPDSILGGPSMGFPEGTLKAIAMSGINGSQYTTNPATLKYPLSGVTYVELANAGRWIAADVEGEGILVVHNAWKNASIEEWKTKQTFRGLVICDDPYRIHSTVVGAIVGLSPSISRGNCIGNGTGNILFSNEAIATATGSIIGNAGGPCDAQVLAWWE
ncbi:MAG: hypothetical protein HY960_00210 [Ignavibacteriae bacterium]|nr:hypothetical protein [Ignavibacteriota bacterium]